MKILAIGSAGVLAFGLLAPVVGKAECRSSNWTPNSRYEIKDNGSQVYDLQSRMTWKRCIEGMQWDGSSCIGKPLTMSWFMMRDSYPATGDGWRVPNIDELASLRSGTQKGTIDLLESGNIGCWGPAINTSIFPSGDYFTWSSSPKAGDSNYAWGVDFKDGYVRYGYRYQGNNIVVRLVRSELWTGRLGMNTALVDRPYSFEPGSGLEEMQELCKTSGADECFDRLSIDYSSNSVQSLIAARRNEKINIYKEDYRRSKSSADYNDFIIKYRDFDPDNLVQSARIKMESLLKSEKYKSYRDAFKSAKTSKDFFNFMDLYRDFDPDKLVPVAEKKRVEAEKRENLKVYRSRYQSASTSSDFEYFIRDYESDDPDKLVPKARKQLAVVINREREEKAQKEKQQRLEKAAECDGYYQGKVLYWSFDQCSALFGCLKLRFSGVVLGSGDGKVTLRMIEGKERYGEVTERECYLFKKGL